MNENLTEIVYILDRSGSMSPLRSAAVESFNDFVQEQKDATGEARMSLILFDHEYTPVHQSTPIKRVPLLDSESYCPRGGTALLDAIGLTINRLGARLRSLPEEERPGRVIVAIYTDGFENSSKEFDNAEIKRLITQQREVYSWDFLFFATEEEAVITAGQMGILERQSVRVHDGAYGQVRATRTASKLISGYRERAAHSFKEAGQFMMESHLESFYQGLEDEL